MDASTIKNIKVSFFPSKERMSTGDMTISSVLAEIKSGKYKVKIESARNARMLGQYERANEIKGTLPAVTFSGLYPERRKDGFCVRYNNVIVLDIDKQDVVKMAIVKKYLLEDKYITAFWISPSGNGYKGLVKLQYDEQYSDVSLHDKHCAAFAALYTYMLSTYGIELDKSGSDPTRLCFMSYDPDLVIKSKMDAFPVAIEMLQLQSTHKRLKANEKINIEHQITYKEYDWNRLRGQKWTLENYETNKQTLYFIYRKMQKKQISITSTFEEWVKVAFAIANSMHPDVGHKMFIQMCELDGVNHNPDGSERLIYDAYCNNRGNVHFETIIYLAKQKGVIA